jgi:hypothetical protein
MIDSVILIIVILILLGLAFAFFKIKQIFKEIMDRLAEKDAEKESKKPAGSVYRDRDGLLDYRAYNKNIGDKENIAK